MKPTLLVLAAGMGSRYGGLKQMDGLGPNGETIIDYSIYDAVNAGFGKVVYIVREYFREQFEQTVKDKYSGITCPDGTPLEFDFVIQELDKIPSRFKLNPERQKPWGTAHAVLMAKDVIHEPFAVKANGPYVPSSNRSARLAEYGRTAPFTVRSGCFATGSRQPSSSVRCQWRTFILWNARSSSVRRIAALPKKCRASSSITPRQSYAGLSSIVRAGSVSGNSTGLTSSG